MQRLKELSITIVTHVYATGPSFKLEEYLKNKVKRLVFIGHPFSFANDTRSFIRFYQNGKLIYDKKFTRWRGPEALFYFKDLLLTLWWCFKYSRDKCHYFIGVNNFNVFSGYIVKLFGKVENIVFYTIDYIPQRFDNTIMNSIYHWMDRFAISKSQKVWNLSPLMTYQREKNGVEKKYRQKQIVVPIGTDMNSKPLPFNKIDRNKIVFMGHLRNGQGVEMLIDAIKDVAIKVPKVHLLIVGGGPLESKYKSQVNALGLGQKIKFSGFVKNFSDVEKLLQNAAVAVAPYVDDDKTYTRYTDPGKPKDYLASGLPVVITKVPQVAFEIEKNKCGFAINYNKNELKDAIIKLLTNKKLLIFFRKNALKMAKKYRWNKVFEEAFSQTL